MGFVANLIQFFRGPAPETDPGMVALVDAYSRLEQTERHTMIGRLADSAYGIQRRPIYITTRWQPSHRDQILAECESGSMLRLGYLLDAMKSDGTIAGLMDTRTGGMLRRPHVFTGDPFLCDLLRGRPATYSDDGVVIDPGVPGVFQQMVPVAELAAIVWDAIQAGIGIGEMVQGPDGLPVLRHLDIHWLRYDYGEDRWIYQAPGGTYVVRPGDGRWVLLTIKSARRPWMHGAWFPLCWPFISKAGTALDRLRWQGQLADSLKVIQASKSSTEPQRNKLMRFITEKWHRAPGLVTRDDEKAYLVESNGIGFKVYCDAEDRADRDIQFTLSGQVVTGDGNKGFSSGDIFDAIKNDLIEGTAGPEGDCVTRDIIAPWARRFWGCVDGPRAALDVRSPAQRKAESEAISAAIDTVTKADAMAAPRGQRVDLAAFLAEQKIAIPLESIGGDDDLADDAPPSYEREVRLADAMTEHAAPRCEHGSSNRCTKCGVERERELVPGVNGAAPTWRIVWRAIGVPDVPPALPAGPASPGTVPA